MRKDPMKFECQCCGNCCRWPGPVRVNDEEIARIAEFLGIEEGDFRCRRTRLAPDRTSLSLLEKADGSCEFLTADNLCAINPVKPQQCMDYPERWDTTPEFRHMCPGRANE